MDCQNTAKTLKINKNKTLGRVIVVVEGEDEEFKLLKHIFEKVLGYSYVEFNRRSKTMKKCFINKNNSNSVVIIANTNGSSLSSIVDDTEYQDKLYRLLQEDYQESLSNVPIYFIWDRDRFTNSKDEVSLILDMYSNSRDNGFGMNGMLLLSYPCVECYELANIQKHEFKNSYSTSDECKKGKNKSKFRIKNINEKTLLLAAENMHRVLLEFGIKNYNTDNFKHTNKRIFRKQEEYYKDYELIRSLSLISIMLIDMGIIVKE